MSHLRYGPVNLGHGPAEAVGEEALSVADPGGRASEPVERGLRTVPVVQAPFLAADAADFAQGRATSPTVGPAQEVALGGAEVGADVAGGAADAGASVPRQFDERQGGGFADVSTEVAGDVANEAGRQISLAVEGASQLGPDWLDEASFGVVVVVVLAALAVAFGQLFDVNVGDE